MIEKQKYSFTPSHRYLLLGLQELTLSPGLQLKENLSLSPVFKDILILIHVW